MAVWPLPSWPRISDSASGGSLLHDIRCSADPHSEDTAAITDRVNSGCKERIIKGLAHITQHMQTGFYNVPHLCVSGHKGHENMPFCLTFAGEGLLACQLFSTGSFQRTLQSQQKFAHKPVETETIYTCHNKALVPAPQMINSINNGGVWKYAHPGILIPGNKQFLLQLISLVSASTTYQLLLQ